MTAAWSTLELHSTPLEGDHQYWSGSFNIYHLHNPIRSILSSPIQKRYDCPMQYQLTASHQKSYAFVWKEQYRQRRFLDYCRKAPPKKLGFLSHLILKKIPNRPTAMAQLRFLAKTKLIRKRISIFQEKVIKMHRPACISTFTAIRKRIFY